MLKRRRKKCVLLIHFIQRTTKTLDSLLHLFDSPDRRICFGLMFLLLLFFKSVEQQLEISLMTAEEQEKEGKFLQVVFFFFFKSSYRQFYTCFEIFI